MALTKVVGELIDIGDLDISNVGSIQLDSIAGDADSNTSITFSGSDVITVATGGTTALTVDASQVLNLTSHLDMPDSANVKLGTGDDLLLYHDGTNSKIETASGSSGDLYIAAQGTNHDLYLRADDDIKIQPQGGEDGITLVGNGAVTLYYDNSAKLATASDGVDITGDVGATTATIAGNITQSDGDYLYTGGGNFDIKHNTASQNIVFSTTPSGGSATEVLRITHDGKLSRLSGDLTLDVAGRIDLSADDNGEVRLYDGSSMYGQFKDDSDRFTIQGLIADADMLFVINDGGTATTALKLDAADGGDALFYGDLQAPGIYVGSTNTSYDFYNNGTSYLNGAVTVDDALTVANAITVTNGNSTFTTASSWGAGLTIKQTNDDASPAYLSLHKDPASGHSTLADNDYIGFINMKAKDDAGNAHTYVELAGVATDVSSGAETSKFTINTWGAGTEYPTNLVATGGKVGIGTTSPDYLLDVSKSNVGGNTDMRLFNESTSNAASGTRSIISVANANVGDPRIVLAVTGVKEYSLGIDNSDSDKFKINNGSDPSSGTNYLTIDGGNVGIGTTSPVAKLSIQKGGGTAITDTDDTLILSDSDYSSFTMEHYNAASGSRNIRFRNNAAILTVERLNDAGTSVTSTTMAIDTPSGFVGIGTTAPGALLETYKSANYTKHWRIHRPGTAEFGIGTVGSHLHISSGSSMPASSNKGLFMQFNTGEIGIWKESVSGIALDLNGVIRANTGIEFGSDTAAANQLDDYEEGTWTPTIYGDTTAGSTSGGTIGGTYTKIGNLVTASFSILDVTTSGMAGVLKIGAWPFTAQGPNNRDQMGVCRMYKFDYHTNNGAVVPMPSIADNGTYCHFVQSKDAVAWDLVNVTNSSNLYIEGTIAYMT